MPVPTRLCFLILAAGCWQARAEEIRTADGLMLSVSEAGAAEAVVGGESTFRPAQVPKPVFRIREIGAKEWTDLVGTIERKADQLHQTAAVHDLGLALEASYAAHADRIEITGAVIDQRAAERSVELMCALPARAPNTRWGVDIAETADPNTKAVRPSAPARATGPYALWIDAFDLDPEMVSVSLVAPDEKKRVLAILSAADTAPVVNQKWRTFVVPGIQEADFADGTLRVRIVNFTGGSSQVNIGAIYLVGGDEATFDDDRASALMAESEDAVQKLSIGSWVYAPGRRTTKEGRIWFFEVKGLSITDGSWTEFVLRRGAHREGEVSALPSGALPLTPNDDGELRGLGYPWATITQKGAGGYSLAVSPELPCQYRFQYDVNAKEVQLVLSYGLSALPQRPELKSRAPFRLILYRTDNAWGFREAAQRYHALAPELFKQPTDRFGFWYGAGPYKDYRGLDGEYAYLEVHEARLYPRHFIKDRAEWEQWKERLGEYFPRHSELGILVLPYRHFYHCSLHVKGDMDGTLPHMPETYEEAIKMLKTLSLPFANGYGHHLREVIDSSTMQGKDGRVDVKLSADDACAPTGRLIFRTSISPFLYEDRPEVMTNARSEMEFARELLKAFPQVGGIYYDAGAAGGGTDFHPEHLRYAHSPLVPGPGISRMAGKYEFGRWMGEFLHASGKVHFVNGGAGMSPAQVWHILPYDCIGVEWPPVSGGGRRLRFLRTMAGRKPVSFLKIQLAGDLESAFQVYAGTLGVYGIFPPPGVVKVGVRARAGTADTWVAPYAELFQRMYLAGWQPVTHARCSHADLLAERFGPLDGRVYFAVFNPTLSAADTELLIDAGALGMPQLSKAVAFFAPKEDVALEPAGDGRYRASLQIPAQRLVVLEAGEREVDDPRQITDYYPAKHRAWEAEVTKPRLMGRWDFNEGRGQLASDTSGSSAHGALGTRSVVEDCDPRWVGEGYTGGALQFDGQDDIVIVRDMSRFAIREAFTIEAWIKLARRTQHARVADFGGTCLYFDATGNRVGLRIGGYSVNTAWSTPIPLDKWTHLKGTYDGHTIKIYVDGKLCEAKPFECESPLSGQPMTIGNASILERPFAGIIDEVRFWNYAK